MLHSSLALVPLVHWEERRCKYINIPLISIFNAKLTKDLNNFGCSDDAGKEDLRTIICQVTRDQLTKRTGSLIKFGKVVSRPAFALNTSHWSDFGT